MLTRVRVPGFPEGMQGAYLKFGYHHRPTLGLGAAVRVVDGVFADVRLTLGSVSPTPMRLRGAEDALRGERVDSATAIAAAGQLAADACDAIDDLHGTAEYKRHIVSVFVGRALTEAVERGER